MEQRFTQFTFADKCMETLIRNFTESPASTGVSLEDLRCIRDFLEQYEEDGSIAHMPCFGDLHVPLPIKFCMVVGNAGSGKTTALKNMMFRDNTMTVVGTTNSACNNFISELARISKPHTFFTGGMIRNTIHKLLYIDYSSSMTRHIYETVLQNEELQQHCASHMKKMSCLDEKKELQLYWGNLLKYIHPLYKECVSKIQKEFTSYKGYKYQLVSNGSKHSFNVAKDLLFKSDLAKQSGENNDALFYDINYAKSKVQLANQVDSQLAYLQYVSMIHSKKSWEGCGEDTHYPNPLILRHKIIVEEAGRMACPMTTLLILIWWRVNFLYNTPQLRTKIPVILLSGSTTQSGVIGFPTSMLDELFTPFMLCKKNEILAISSEFNRRRKNKFEHPISEMHKVLCTHLEKHIEMPDNIFDSLMFCEVFQREVSDPNFHTDALRIFQFHKNCSDYELNLEKAEKATVEVYDTIYVSSNIITITPPMTSEINTEYLSVLTEKQAENNRMVMWKKKAYLYKDDLSCSLTPLPNLKNCASFFKSEDSYDGFDEKYEEYIMSVYHEIKKMYAGIRASIHQKDSTDCENPSKKQKLSANIEDGVHYDEAAKISTNNNEVGDENLTFRYIIGPARLLLSSSEHKRERIYSQEIAHKLGKGEHLSKLYYESSKVTNQSSEMFYDPYFDVCIQIADPDYNSIDDNEFKKSIASTSTALQTFLAYRRKRNFAKFSGVTNTMSRTRVKLKGIHGTLQELLMSHEFMNVCSDSFKICVYSQVISEFKCWVDIQTQTDITECASIQKLLDSYHTLIADPHSHSKVGSLCNMLYTMVHALYKNAKVSIFVNHHQMKLYIENDIFWNRLRFSKNSVGLSKSLPLQDLKLLDIGNLSVLGNGLHECNSQEYQLAQANKPTHFKLGNNSWEEYQHSKGKKNASRVISHEVSRLFPELTIQSTMTLLLKELLVVVTVPEYSTKLRWSDVFLMNQNPYKPRDCRFGLLTRRECPPISSQTSRLFHQFANRPFGQLMNFPKPFIRHRYDHIQTDIILKTAYGIQPLSNNYKVLDAVFDSSMNKAYLQESTLSENATTENELKSKKPDLHFTTYCLMNPMFSVGAATVDSTQGQTVPKYITNLAAMDHTKYLVTMTRGENSDNILLAGLNDAQKKVNRLHSEAHKKLLSRNRAHLSAIAPYIHIRQ